MKREASDHITFDRVFNGRSYHHTGYEVLIAGIWYYEFEDDEGNLEYC